MPFTHSYSSSGIAARASQNKGTHKPAGHDSSNSISSSSVDASSSLNRTPSRSTISDLASTSEQESSARSRLFSSGRKSPDPFRRFRRLSSSNSLNTTSAPAALDDSQSFDSQQSYPAAYTDTRIPAYPGASRRAASPSPLETPRSAPPPLPSSSTKPLFQRPKRTKSSSISILSSGLGLRSRDTTFDISSSTDTRRRHRKSASLSGSDVDFSSSAINSQRAATPQPMFRSASPSPSLSEATYPTNHGQPPLRPTAPSLSSASSISKQHKQAWYQAQQKTIELDNPNNRDARGSNSDSAKLFPLNVSVRGEGERSRSSPTDSRSPRPAVETFLSEEEMLAAGIHIIRRRDGTKDSPSSSSKDSQGLETPHSRDQAVLPAMPARLYGADQPDFLELIDSPADSKHTSPTFDRMADPPTSSASMRKALSHSHHKSSSGSISASSSGSTDYVPFSTSHHDDPSSVHNGSTTSLGSSSKHSFSFAKLRRAVPKPSSAAGASRPSTANSSNEDVSGNKTFLFPSRSQQKHQQQQQSTPNGEVSAPGYLTPGPSSSASPFLNKHSASVGRASGSVGGGHTARNGLAQVFNGGGSSAATMGPSYSAHHASARNGVPPPKPPKPKPSLLTAFPRPASRSLSGSISAPNTAPLDSRHGSNGRFATHRQDTLQPPASAGLANGFYRSMSHSRSQEAVAEARLDAEALRASAGTPLPPPRRLNPPRAGAASAASQYSSTAMGRTTSSNSGGVVGALGHVGQLGAAMGRRGWDFMKTLQSANGGTGGGGSLSGRVDGGGYAPGYRLGGQLASSAAATAANEPTRQWLLLLEGPDTATMASTGVFGAPLKDAVLRSRLSSIVSEPEDHLGVPDLGKDFSASFLQSPGATPRASVAGATNEPLSREEARCLFLPRVVVRCIESLEKWGPSEEGIYRISGRSSHTAKLRLHLSDPRNDLRIDEINPADLDINSVCSLLKSYLRELPEPLLPGTQGKVLDQAVARLLAEVEEDTPATEGSGRATDARAARLAPEKVAEELAPLMRQLPVYNWYLLRELAHHLGMLSQPEVVRSTKMPISNLTLVLAPTVSISLPLLQVLVRHREVVFRGPVPSEGVAAVGAGLEGGGVSQGKRSPPPRPAKPEKLGSPVSRLPVMVRKRASSIGLGALLSSPTRNKASPAQESRHVHRHTPSTTPSLDLPSFISGTREADTVPASPSRPGLDPYNRPSTSLGHFAAHSRDTNEGVDPSSTPIARYYSRFRSDERDASSPIVGASSPNLGPSSAMDEAEAGRSGRTSALDRPRPKTSREGFFAAGERRRRAHESFTGLLGDAYP